ncbi:MAG: hypothetical protein JNJ55_11035 [Betaproteobacteria bacterium]|nr:hypothetical protein [Betaproteobacteria bacterium]
MKIILITWALVMVTLAQAQTTTVSITPAVAAPGVKRTITIDTVQLQGCQATSTRVGTTEVNWQWTLTVHLDGGRSPVPVSCDVVQPYRYVVEYTPEYEGELKVLVFDSRTNGAGGLLADTRMTTRSPATTRSVHDLTGIWYDPATNGSGLTFIHSATRGDAAFGTWFLYDGQGRPRWYTIQNIAWKPGGTEAEGLLLESSAAINICPLTIIGCPLAAAIIAPAGKARIVMHAADRARIEAISNSGQPVFASNVVRPAI